MARDVDHGFNEIVFAQMLGMSDRYSDLDLGLDRSLEPVEVRQFFACWAQELGSAGP